jgi:hypothetical protein
MFILKNYVNIVNLFRISKFILLNVDNFFKSLKINEL